MSFSMSLSLLMKGQFDWGPLFEYLGLVYYSVSNESLYTVSFWVQLTLQSEGFALIALSYLLKDRAGEILKPRVFLDHLRSSPTELKDVLISILALVVISVPVALRMTK